MNESIEYGALCHSIQLSFDLILTTYSGVMASFELYLSVRRGRGAWVDPSPASEWVTPYPCAPLAQNAFRKWLMLLELLSIYILNHINKALLYPFSHINRLNEA
jgi:hypothetical protein